MSSSRAILEYAAMGSIHPNSVWTTLGGICWLDIGGNMTVGPGGGGGCLKAVELRWGCDGGFPSYSKANRRGLCESLEEFFFIGRAHVSTEDKATR